MAKPTKATTNYYKGVFYFGKSEAEEYASETGGTIAKTSRGYTVSVGGDVVGPSTKERNEPPTREAIIKFRFDDKAPQATREAERKAAKLVKEISEETQRNIRNMIVESIRDGIPPYDAARMIVPTIGLTSSQGQAVMKFRKKLIDSGLSLERVNERVDNYAEDLLVRRADTIARTEILEALNAGQEASWLQAQDDGLLSATATKELILSEDACPICESIAEEGPVPVGESFSQPGPPFHPQCRCTVGINRP